MVAQGAEGGDRLGPLSGTEGATLRVPPLSWDRGRLFRPGRSHGSSDCPEGAQIRSPLYTGVHLHPGVLLLPLGSLGTSHSYPLSPEDPLYPGLLPHSPTYPVQCCGATLNYSHSIVRHSSVAGVAMVSLQLCPGWHEWFMVCHKDL